MDLQTILTAFTSLVTLASIIASQTETRNGHGVPW